MFWHSKKELDYRDWKTTLKIKELGLHFTSDGIDLIDFILGQMNNNRLSTTNKSSEVKRTSTEIESIFSGQSNYGIQEDGRTLIKSSNKYFFFYFVWKNIKVELKDPQGSIFKTFNSKTSCAEFLGVSSHTVTKIIKTKRLVLVKNIILIL